MGLPAAVYTALRQTLRRLKQQAPASTGRQAVAFDEHAHKKPRSAGERAGLSLRVSQMGPAAGPRGRVRGGKRPMQEMRGRFQ